MGTPGEKLIFSLLAKSVNDLNESSYNDAGKTIFQQDDCISAKNSLKSKSIKQKKTTKFGVSSKFVHKGEMTQAGEKSNIACQEDKKILLKSQNKMYLKKTNLSFLTNKDSLIIESIGKRKINISRYTNHKIKRTFTSEENEEILKAIQNYGDQLDHRELAKKMDRPPSSVKYKRLKLKSGSRPMTKFSLLEDKLIMDVVLKNLKSGDKFEFMKSDGFEEWQKLSLDLQRRYTVLLGRWKRILQPWILQYCSGTLNLEIRPMLINYLGENFCDIRRHTETSLRHKFQQVLTDAKRKLKKDKIELEEVKEFTEERFKGGSLLEISDKVTIRQLEVVKHFQEYVDKNSLVDIF